MSYYPSCNRSAHDSKFACVSEISEDLLYFLSEMCIFPRSFVIRVRYYERHDSPFPSEDVNIIIQDLFAKSFYPFNGTTHAWYMREL